MLNHFIFPGVHVESCQTKPHTVWIRGRPEAVQDSFCQGVEALKLKSRGACEIVEEYFDQGFRVISVRVR